MNEGSSAPNFESQENLLMLRKGFRRFARAVAEASGSAWVFVVALMIVIGWGVSGPYFGYSDTWQLVINTGTTIITFLMVFLIQNTQNRDAKEIHLKLDELIHSHRGARDRFINLEQLSDEELKRLADGLIDMARLRQ